MSETFVNWVLVPFVEIVLVLLVLLGCVAYLTLLERKVIAFLQVRLGPRRVGPRGLLQPIADVVKLLLKEDIVPSRVDRLMYFVAPVIILMPAIAAFAVIPFSGQPFRVGGIEVTPWITDINVGILFLLAISSLGVYGIVMGGWASNSKYPLLGAMRSAAQMISYEIPLGLAVAAALMVTGTASMVEIVRGQEEAWLLFQRPWNQFLGLFLFFVSSVAETNRAPFDLPEAENELVAGFHTEYSGMKFAFFFLAEYMNMILVGCVVTALFLGGWHPITFGVIPREWMTNWLPFLGPVGATITGLLWFAVKVLGILYVYLWLRATFPRYRYDQLMGLGWKWFIPLGLLHIVVTGVLLLVFPA